MIRKNEKTDRAGKIWWRILLLGFFALLLTVGFSGVEAKAATTGFRWLKNNSNYKKYDLDGDGQNDKICLKTSGKGTSSFSGTFYVNGKKAGSVRKKTRSYKTINARYGVITLDNGKSFLVVCGIADDNVHENRLYRIKNGKLRHIASINSSFTDYEWSMDGEIANVTVSGNEVTFRILTSLAMTGIMNYDVTYKYKSASLVLASREGTAAAGSWLKVTQAFKAYKKAGGSSLSFQASKGDGLYLQGYCLKDGKLYLKFRKKNQKTGWVRVPTSKALASTLKSLKYAHSAYFSNGYFF